MVSLKSVDGLGLVLGREELSLYIIREVVDGPEGEEAEDNSKETFKDEDPSPAGAVTDIIHILDSSGEEATERTYDSCYGEEESLE